MLKRRYLFPRVIEMNYQAARRLGTNVYLIDGGSGWALLDTGFEDAIDEMVEMIRQMDFQLSKCKLIVATHADADHIQGVNRARERLKAPVAAHLKTQGPLERADPIETYATITAQNIEIPLKPTKIDRLLAEGDRVEVGEVVLEVWHTPGHTPGQLSFKMGDLLFCGDNIYKDGCVGVIDAHHGSNLPDFVRSLERIRDDDAKYLLPSHGPAFRNDPKTLNRAIERLTGYMNMPDFGTCATGWPLLDEWEREVTSGKMPKFG